MEAQEELLDFAIIVGINLFFLGLITLVLWPFGWLAFVGQLAWGYLALWIVLFLFATVHGWIERWLRVNMYDHYNLYVVINLLATLWLILGWSTYAAQLANHYSASESGWRVGVVVTVGLLSSYVGSLVVTLIYRGTIYQLASIPAALLGFIVFTLWPASGQFLYGWFFDLITFGTP